jgi:hypothetical protein
LRPECGNASLVRIPLELQYLCIKDFTERFCCAEEPSRAEVQLRIISFLPLLIAQVMKA